MANLHAEDGQRTLETGTERLAPLAFLANACWEGSLPEFVATAPGADRSKLSHCVRWILGGHALRDTISIKGASPPVRGETTYYWDAEDQTLKYIFWSVTGSHSMGTVRAQDSTLVFDDERLIGSSGIVYFRTTWTQTGPDSYVQDRQRRAEGGDWTDTAQSVYVRKPLLAPADGPEAGLRE